MYPRECCRRCREFSGLVDYVDTGDCDSCFQDSEYDECCDFGFLGCCKGYLLESFWFLAAIRRLGSVSVRVDR